MDDEIVIEVWKDRAYAENERRYAAEHRRDIAEAALVALRAEVGKIADELSAESYVYRQIVSRLRALVTDQSPAAPPPCGHRDYDLGTNLPVVCVAPHGHPISKHRFDFADAPPTSDTQTDPGGETA